MVILGFLLIFLPGDYLSWRLSPFFSFFVHLTFDHTNCLMPETWGQPGRELKSAMSSATVAPRRRLHLNGCLTARFIKRTRMHTAQV